MARQELVVSGTVVSVLIGRRFVDVIDLSGRSRLVSVDDIIVHCDGKKREGKVFKGMVTMKMVKKFLEDELIDSLTGWISA